MKTVYGLIFFLLMMCNVGLAQDEVKPIQIVNADAAESHPTRPKTVILSGNIHFYHDSTDMYCDSAYFFQDSNSLMAFQRVRAFRGDSIKLIADTLYYRGFSKTADLFGNIRLTDRQTNLATQQLSYDFKTETGSYLNSAVIRNSSDNSILSSKIGIYKSKINTFYFKDSVVLKNPENTLYSDSLVYHNDIELSEFFGPTTIIGEETAVYCERGDYSSLTYESHLWENPCISSKSLDVVADSIFFNQEKEEARLYNNVWIVDTVEHINIWGDYSYYNNLIDSSAVEGNALMHQEFEKDTLMLKANNIYLKTDSTGQKSISAFNEVKVFKSDFNAVCDSLTYNDSDSTMRFHNDPILWSDNSQITGEYIEAITDSIGIDRMYVNKNAFIISKIDSSMYNQVKGQELYAYFDTNAIRKVEVIGNGQTIYYLQEQDSNYVDMNIAKCANIVMLFDHQNVEVIKFLDTPTAIQNAILRVTESKRKLDGFKWNDLLRPRREEFSFTYKL